MSSTSRPQPEDIIARGRIFELVALPQADGRTFEMARRAPGVRVIIADASTQQLLLTKEYRTELQGWDYRLPGGKVFDTLAEYEEFRASTKPILDAAASKAKAESAEEAGVDVAEVELYKVSKLGATVEWDLYIFEATSWSKLKGGQTLEAGENIQADTWVTFEETKRMILAGDMQEERVALILLQWLAKHN